LIFLISISLKNAFPEREPTLKLFDASVSYMAVSREYNYFWGTEQLLKPEEEKL
jgi:hypothetical protein